MNRNPQADTVDDLMTVQEIIEQSRAGTGPKCQY